MDIRKKIIDYVRTQINIDLDQFRTDFSRKWERENEIIVEYREMSRSQWRNVEILATKGRIRIEDVGVWGKMIAWK